MIPRNPGTEVCDSTHNSELLGAVYTVHEFPNRLEQKSYRFFTTINIVIVYRCPFSPFGWHNFFVVQIIRVNILEYKREHSKIMSVSYSGSSSVLSTQPEPLDSHPQSGL